MKYLAFFLLVFSGISQAQNYPRVSGTEYDFLEDGVTYEFLEGETVSSTFGDLPNQTVTITCSHQIKQQREALWDSAGKESSTCLERAEKTRDACNATGTKECKRLSAESENKASHCFDSQVKQKCYGISYDSDYVVKFLSCTGDLRKECDTHYLLKYDCRQKTWDNCYDTYENDTDSCWNKFHQTTNSEQSDTLGQQYVLYESLCFQPVKHKRGRWDCDDSHLTEAMRNSESQYDRYLYYSCLVIRGNESEGLPELYLLADQPGGWEQNSIEANYFLGIYLMTDGKLDGVIRIKAREGEPTLRPTGQDRERIFGQNGALKYFYAAQALAKLENDPNNDFEEALSAILVTEIHLNNSFLAKHHDPILDTGAGSIDFGGDSDNLENITRFGEECANLPNRTGREGSSLKPELYQKITTNCRFIADTVPRLQQLDKKRRQILSQPHCAAVRERIPEIMENYNDPNCPEYDELHTELDSFAEEISTGLAQQ